MAIVIGPETRLDVSGRGGEARQIRLLRQVTDGGVGLQEAGAAVRLDPPCGDLEQGRLAGPVASDEAYALAGCDREIDAIEQRRAAEGQRDAAELEQRGSHRQGACWVRCSRRIVWSSADRKAERSRGENAGGPPPIWPVSRRSAIRLRMASAMPIDASVNGRPFVAMTLEPALRQRLASGVSLVTTMTAGSARWAIQSSAASRPGPTVMRSIMPSRGTWIGLLATT